MIETTLNSTIGADGQLHLVLPAGFGAEGQQVEVKVRYQPDRFKTHQEYMDWVDSISGTWKGEFHTSPLLPLEKRDSMS